MAPSVAAAQSSQAFVSFDIPAQDLDSALTRFGQQSEREIIISSALTRNRHAPAVQGNLTPEAALHLLLADSGLTYRVSSAGSIVVEPDADPQGSSAVGDGAEVEALIVTAQKREENIQDVPIAISAFSQKALEEQKIEGGFDLLKAIPNVTFSKNNFTSYNFSIRGIGTKAVSATTDPGVAVSFNNIALLQNRLFEQEYFDIDRVEVLRGPQGTLYGRNATAGVINVITAKPHLGEFRGWVKGEVGNYDTKRISAMVNVPLVEDKLAIRVAGALTSRQGYDFNTVTENPVNGRELWSGRVTIGFEPTENIRANLVWERFEEDDNRSRTGKQVCHRDPGPTHIGDTRIADDINNSWHTNLGSALFSQGCQPGNMYDDMAYGTPNGLALPFVFGMIMLGASCNGCPPPLASLGMDSNGNRRTLINIQDPYDGMMQSRNMREIASFRDPVYRAKADVIQLNVDIDLSESLTFSSQTAYNKDTTYSFQDFNRFNTVPIFFDTNDLWSRITPTKVASPWQYLAPNGEFCDPQLGCSDTMAGFDIAQATGEQFAQEFRLQSDFDGPLNFSAGANYTEFEALVDYYIFFNLISAMAQIGPFRSHSTLPGYDTFEYCHQTVDYGFFNHNPPVLTGETPNAICPYIDPNPIESINGEGHNYFRSKNPYRLKSGAVFGEVYWEAREDLKVTAGLRYTDDRKHFIPVPSQVLTAQGAYAGGVVNRGYPELPPIKQKWGEFTGRIGIDWKPVLPFTDSTMLYAFYSHGYKGGGANPPTPGFATAEETGAQIGYPPETVALFKEFGLLPVMQLNGAEYGPTFLPEFVDAFEFGAKNTLLGGALVFNASAFYYDYTDYQVSQIRDRSAVNENFDATIWGLEFETLFSPTRNLRIIANVGYLDTQIADGEKSIDIMNRTQGNPDYVVVKPWVQQTSNCVLPRHVVEAWLNKPQSSSYWGYNFMCGGGGFAGVSGNVANDPLFGNTRYNKANYPELNDGAGLWADLSGNELPNSPHWTANIGAQYSMDFAENWKATLRGDAYWQSQSWARVYNADPYDKLHGWYNANLSLWIENDDGLKIELYAKNILDDTPITDAFLNSDDTALTTNVFVLDPRLIGLSIRKEF